MRKLGSRRKEEKKQKRKQLIVGVVLASILFVSIFGYSFGRGGNAKKIRLYTMDMNLLNKMVFGLLKLEILNFHLDTTQMR